MEGSERSPGNTSEKSSGDSLKHSTELATSPQCSNNLLQNGVNDGANVLVFVIAELETDRPER